MTTKSRRLSYKHPRNQKTDHSVHRKNMKTGPSRILIPAIIISLNIAEAWSQAQFSPNAVGYEDVTFVAGSNLVANLPLTAANNTISNLFNGVPDGTIFLPWNTNAAAFGPTNSFSTASGWADPNATLVLPHGGFLWLPAATTISFAGEPALPGGLFAACYHYPSGRSVTVMPSSSCAGALQPVPDGTQLARWNRVRQDWELYFWVNVGDPAFNGWYDEAFNKVDVHLDPGESARF
ncbi:MAG TPA: hypothetical protein VNT99_13135, partial [Methylomirabilota bacterium]|nr:hypothetical protein [Methylomirabilota bacterium]